MTIKSSSILSLIFIICLSFASKGNTDDLIKQGLELIDIELYSDAEEKFDQAISMDPSNPEAWWGKGFALNNIAYEMDSAKKFSEARGYYEEAIKCFEKTIQLNSSYLDAYMDMADSENRLDNSEKAFELIDKAISIDPDNANAINVKGTIYYRLGKYNEALELYREAAKIDPNCGYAWFNICDLLKEQRKGDPNTAAESDNACQKAAEIFNEPMIAN
jgi:tetratricopeptide (TPR) repeat protein